MTAADKALIACLKHKDADCLVSINREWLDADELVRYNFCIDYYRDHGELMGARTFCAQYSLDALQADSRPGIYVRQLKNRFIFGEITENVPALLRKAKDKPREVLQQLTDLVSALNSEESVSTDSKYEHGKDERLALYDERIGNNGVTHLSFGNKLLDKLFYGVQKNDLITFAGKGGSKKTWLMCYLAMLMEAVLPEDMNDLLFVTNEMSAEEIKGRMDCIRFNLPYGAFLDGTLSRAQYRRYATGIADLKYSRIQFVDGCDTLVELSHKILLYRPSCTFIDGSNLLESTYKGDEWKKILYITRNLKRITRNKHFPAPIINTTHLRRGSGKGAKSTSFDAQDEFAGGITYVNDSDLAIMMYADKEMMFRNEVGLQVAKGRRVEAGIDPLFLANLNLPAFDFFLEADAPPVSTVTTALPV